MTNIQPDPSNAAVPCQESQPQASPYSVPSLITALDQRYQEELRIKDMNQENIDNLSKILEALKAIS
jgi:hypothetical protein